MEHYVITKDFQLYNVKDKGHSVDIRQLKCDTSCFVEKFGVDVSNVEKGVFKANVSAWSHFHKNSDDRYCLITEEGVDVQTDLDEITLSLDEIEGEWEVFFPYDKIHFTENNYPVSVSRFGFFWGTYCYCVNRDSVRELITYFQSIDSPLDEQLLTRAINKDLRFICAETDWFRYDQSNSPSLMARKETVNKYVKNYRVWADDEIAQVRSLLKYLSTIANEIDVKIFLHAGTLLGAVRHGKIMDWDDDVDLMIDSKDRESLISRVIQDGVYNVTEWEWKKTGRLYYKIWKEGGFKVDGYEYTFPFVDIWMVDTDKETQSAETSDGYAFRYDTYYPLVETVFEDVQLYLPHKNVDILDGMYKGWREEIKIFSWSHKLKQHTVRQMTAFIETDNNGRFVKFK